MRLWEGRWKRLCLAFLAGCATLATMVQRDAPGQQLAGGNKNGFIAGQGAVPLPPPPPRGAWGAVIMSNNKWLVIQNSEGKQFPIAYDAVNQFLIRWPTSLAALTENSVVEAVGTDLGSNQMATDHVDVFEGPDQTLVNPTFTSLMPNNRPITTIDPRFNRFMNGIEIAANLWYGWAYPPEVDGPVLPARTHVVGRVMTRDPLVAAFNTTNFATILPPQPGGMTLTQVTRGAPGDVEKEDFVYLMPTDLSERSVILSQLVVYKKLTQRQFRAR
jgi:hypothetical protein